MGLFDSLKRRWVAASQPWRLLGLQYPTSSRNNPHFLPWIYFVEERLLEGEVLIDFGLCNQMAALRADPGTASGEGKYAVTNQRSLVVRDADPPEARLWVVLHRNVEFIRVERAWADPYSGGVRVESEAPDEEAIRYAEVSMPEMAIVSLAHDGRLDQFLVGRSAGANWGTLVERFKGEPTMPEGWWSPS